MRARPKCHIRRDYQVGLTGVPWHGLGTAVPDLMTAAEAVAAAGLDWLVECEPITTARCEPIDFKRAVVRQSDRAVLGIVGNGYSPVQNASAFDFADAIVADDGNHFETAGALDGGRTTFLSLELKAVEPITVKGDGLIDTFLLLSNSHDGSKSLRVTITPVRVVCQNTLNLAFKGAKGVFSIRHSGDITTKMRAAREALGISIDYMRRFEQVAQALMDLTVTTDLAEKVIRDAFEMRASVEEARDTERYANAHATRALGILDTTADLQSIRGTGWGVLNAVAQHIDHDRSYGRGSGREAVDVKMSDLLWGGGADVLNRTVALLDPKIAKLMDPAVVRQAARVATRVKVVS